MTSPPLQMLRRGVESYEPWLLPSGEMGDPVFGEPTQYGTPYHAWCQAILGLHGEPAEREARYAKAARGLQASLDHVAADPATVNTLAGMDRVTGDRDHRSHRDFFWPPILKTWQLLRDADVAGHQAMGEQIAALDVERQFASRPPSNWSAVWLSGEWLRLQEGLSPWTRADFDERLGIFFDSRLLVEQGLYQEPGLSNSYDLFTRLHLAELLVAGYDGAWRAPLEELLETGLRRSLGVQLSDGSLASAHRSTGQTWTLGAQIAFFTLAAKRLCGSDLGARAEQASRLALSSFARWQRPDGPYSPVENLLPPAFRIGYQSYTADGHYGNLALGFLASAIDHGCVWGPLMELDREPEVMTEWEPTWRGLVHAGRYSVQVNTAPAPGYDGFGLIDLTTGPGRYLQLVSSVKPTGQDRCLRFGLVPRRDGLLVDVIPADWLIAEPLRHGDTPGSLTFAARPRGQDWRYTADLRASSDGIELEERLEGWNGETVLLIPYLRDHGGPELTAAEVVGDEVVLTQGDEQLVLSLDGVTVDRVLHLPHGYENRRGLCGLLRLDLTPPADRLRLLIRAE